MRPFKTFKYSPKHIIHLNHTNGESPVNAMAVGLHVSNYLCLPDLLCFTNYRSQTQQEHLFFGVWASCQFVTPSWRCSDVIKVKRHILILWNLNVKTPQICIVLFTAQPSRPTAWFILYPGQSQIGILLRKLRSIIFCMPICDRLHLFRLPHLVFYIVPWQAVEASAIATMRRCLFELSFWDEGRRVLRVEGFLKFNFDFDSDSLP